VGGLGDPAIPQADELDQAADEQARQRPRDLEREGDVRREGGEHDAEGHEAGDRRGEDLEQGQEGDQRQGDGREAAEQRRSRHDPADRAGHEGTGHLEDPAGDDRAHPDVPRPPGGGLLIEPAGDRLGEGRSDHEKHHPERAGGVESQGHGGDVGAAGAAGERERHPGEQQVADHHAHGRAGHQVGEGELGRVAEHGPQDRDRQDQDGEIVDREPEEGVEITRGGPAVAVVVHACRGMSAGRGKKSNFGFGSGGVDGRRGGVPGYTLTPGWLLGGPPNARKISLP